MRTSDDSESDSFPTETWLLDGLKNSANRKVWALFVARYQPLIVGTARRAGLPNEDAEDTAQEALLSFASEYQAGKYNREKGRLKSWLFGIARNKIRSHLARQRRAPCADIDLLTQVIMATTYLETEWEIEWRRAVSRACLEVLRAKFSARDNQIFRWLAEEQKTPDQIAGVYGMKRSAVYVVKHRMLEFIEQIRPEIESKY